MLDFRSRRGAMPRVFHLPLLIGIASLVFQGGASAEVLKAHYLISLLGLPLGTAGVNADIEPKSYHVDATAKLNGIAALVSSAKGSTSASGAINQGRLSPATYTTISANSKMTRTVRMGMSAGNVRAVEISPPIIDDAPDRVPVTEADKHNIVDPMSAVVMPIPSGEPLVGPAACNRSIPVFDGAARFNIDMKYVGTRVVTAKGYSGPVSVCTARYVPVAGYRRNRKTTQFMANNNQMEVWLAPIASAHVAVPFRISILTMLGTTVIEAADFQLEPGE